MNEAFIGDLLYRAYMIDAITDAEVRQACAMLEIKYPPSLLENQNVGEHEAVAQCVRTDALADAGDLGGFLDRAVQLPRRDRVGIAAPRKQPAMG